MCVCVCVCVSHSHSVSLYRVYFDLLQDLLMRVEAAVDKYLYWDEEVTLIEAITAETVSGRAFSLLPSLSLHYFHLLHHSHTLTHHTLHPSQGTTIPDHPVKADSPTDDSVYDDSGVSDVTSSSEQSAGRRLDHVTSHMSSHMTADEALLTEDATSSEKWALVSHTLTISQCHPSHPPLLTPSQASKYCADAKDYLEMMCRDLSSELNQFDLQKELELKQILMDYAARQLERHEKVCNGKHVV